MKKSSKDVGDRFDHEMLQGYRTNEDYIDAAGAVPGYTNYPVEDQLRGESKKRWMRSFRDVDECNEFIAAHPSLRGILKGTARAIMDKMDPRVRAKAIGKLGMKLVRGRAATAAQ